MTALRAARWWHAAVGALFLSGCSSPVVLPPSPPVVEVTMDEYRFAYDHAVPAGRVVFHARNAGRIDHELQLVVIPEEFPLTIDEQVHSPVRQAFATKALLPPGGAGTEGDFAVDLAPGRYALTCFVKDAEGQSHAVKGMTSEFRIE